MKNKALTPISAILLFMLFILTGRSTFAQDNDAALSIPDAAQNETMKYGDSGESSVIPDSGIQMRLWGGIAYGTVFTGSLRLDGNETETDVSSFNAMNTGMEIGYAWNFVGVYLRTEITNHWLKTQGEIPVKKQWMSGEIEAFFKGFWKPIDFMQLYIGIGAGIYLSEKAFLDESDDWNSSHFALPLEIGLEFYLTKNLMIGWRANGGFFGFIKGAFDVRTDITLGFMF